MTKPLSRTVGPESWQALELRHIEALLAVARHGTTSAAADALGYTQAAVSQQIAALERITGEPLFERPGGRRPMQITTAGARLAVHGEAILARAQAASADLAAHRRGHGGELRVGIYQSVGVHILPRLLPAFQAAWPRVSVQLHESPSDRELWAMLERAQLDLAFGMLPLDADCLVADTVLRDPYMLVVPADSPLARRRRPPTLDHIARLPMIGFRSCRNEHRIEALLRGRGYDPRLVLRSDDNTTIQRLVAAGMGVALMPRMTVDLGDPSTAAIPLGDVVPSRVLGLAWHKDRVLPPPADAFREAALALGHALGGDAGETARAAV